MERLEACYFCGAVDDAPLHEVAIAPRARRGDPDATVRVTLCPTCERKVERVLRRLFDRVESRASEGRPVDRLDGPDDGASGGDDEAAEPASRSGGIDRIDISSADDEDEETPRGRRRLFTGPSTPGRSSRSRSGARASVGRSGRDDAGEADDATASEADDAEIIEDGPRVRARATAGDPASLEGVSVAEYNRVMRLLSNRSFPMERLAFVDLATSAYDLDAGTVEAVLDAVIDQGTLAERDGDLVRPGADGGGGA